MNILLQGERYVQRQVGTALRPEYQKVHRTFFCIALDVENVRVLGDFEEIHLKSTVTNECLACGLVTNMIMVHFDEDQFERWEAHPKRCNVLYNP